MEHNTILSKCENCGGPLKRADSTHYECEYCHSSFFVAASDADQAPEAQSTNEIPTPKSSHRPRASLSTQRLTLGALLTAMVIVLQLLGSFIRLGPFSISLVLVPIVIGAATCGPVIGSWLGFVFGMAVLLSGDAAAFLSIHAPGTILTVLLKGTLCAFAAAAVYKLAEKLNRYVAVVFSAIVCPLVNTGIFLLGCRLFFWDTIASWGAAAGFESTVSYAFLGLVGANFLFEMGFNLLLSPVIVRLLNIKKKIA